MTDERTHGNGYNLSTGRSWHYADEAGDLTPWPDGDDYTWDDDDTALDYEAKLQAAERTIANLRGEMQVQRDGALLLASSVGFVALVTGVLVGALIW